MKIKSKVKSKWLSEKKKGNQRGEDGNLDNVDDFDSIEGDRKPLNDSTVDD